MQNIKNMNFSCFASVSTYAGVWAKPTLDYHFRAKYDITNNKYRIYNISAGSDAKVP